MIIRLCAFADEAGSTAEEQIAALNDNMITLAEMRGLNGKNMTSYPLADLNKIREEFNYAGINVFSLGSAIGKVRESVNIEDYIKQMDKACETAKALGAKNIRAFSFYPRFFRHDKKEVIGKLKRLVEITEANGLNYCHENEKGIYGSSAERVSELFDAVPKMKMIYDPANFLQCSQNPSETIALFAEKTEYFHIKDAKGKRVVPAGFGDAKLRELIGTLERDTVFSVEPHLFAFRGNSEYDKSRLSGKYDLKTKRGRFDCAVASCRNLLEECGFENKGDYYEKGEIK